MSIHTSPLRYQIGSFSGRSSESTQRRKEARSTTHDGTLTCLVSSVTVNEWPLVSRGCGAGCTCSGSSITVAMNFLLAGSVGTSSALYVNRRISFQPIPHAAVSGRMAVVALQGSPMPYAVGTPSRRPSSATRRPRRGRRTAARLGHAPGRPLGPRIQSRPRRPVVLRVLRERRTGRPGLAVAAPLRRGRDHPLLRHHHTARRDGPAIRPQAGRRPRARSSHPHPRRRGTARRRAGPGTLSPHPRSACVWFARNCDGELPVLVFAGAPFTMATYCINTGKDMAATRRFAAEQPRVWDALLDRLTTATVDFLRNADPGGRRRVSAVRLLGGNARRATSTAAGRSRVTRPSSRRRPGRRAFCS